MTTPAVWAVRAVEAHAVMRRRFGRGDGTYRRDGRPHLPRAIAHLWPFERALAATLDVAGIAAPLAAGFDASAEIATDLATLERYWRADVQPPAYASDARRGPVGGDIYHDDNAWAGLALIQLERMRPGSGWLTRARAVYASALAGWDHSGSGPSPGGVFWVVQGTGIGRRNHDRNVVSTAPNAELGLHLAELEREREPERVPPTPAGEIGPAEMIAWVQRALGGAGPGGRLYRDKIRGDGSIDEALWSYNQGSMAGAHALLARAGIDPDANLAMAQAIARAALDHYGGAHERQPAAFNAIMFRNLLLLAAQLPDGDLPGRVLTEMDAYAERAWAARDRAGRFRGDGRAPELLHHSAMVSISALLAWDPDDWVKLA